jgi:hypothetical protein
MLFEILIVEHPKKDENGESDELEKLILGPKFVIAHDEQGAIMSLTLDNADKLKKVVQKRMEILIRPFA